MAMAAVLKGFLRLSFFIAIIAGLLDVTENGISLADRHHYHIGKPFISSAIVSIRNGYYVHGCLCMVMFKNQGRFV